MSQRSWMLPDGVEEWLPPDSWDLEALRRKLLDHFRGHDYALVATPIVEHLETLLTGAGSDLEQQTFKFVDPDSGRLLGLRADMTPQAARIAARRYADQPQVRLCYLGTVLRTQASNLGGARAIRQVGCELFGEAGVAGDKEILRLLLATLDCAGVQGHHLDLGHVGIYRAIAARLGLGAEDEALLFDILQRKSQPDLRELTVARQLDAQASLWLRQLMELNGTPAVLQQARAELAELGDEVHQALDLLQALVEDLQQQAPAVPIHIDLAELRGYRYQTGMVFAAYVPGQGRELARGGRYDGVGAAYGCARPATGFSADINELLRLGASAPEESPS